MFNSKNDQENNAGIVWEERVEQVKAQWECVSTGSRSGSPEMTSCWSPICPVFPVWGILHGECINRTYLFFFFGSVFPIYLFKFNHKCVPTSYFAHKNVYILTYCQISTCLNYRLKKLRNYKNEVHEQEVLSSC